MPRAPPIAVLLAVIFVAVCDADIGEVGVHAQKFLQKFGKKVSAIPPAWLGEHATIEPPKGLKNMGSWTAVCFTEEQQARLGVDEQGRSPDERGKDTSDTHSEEKPCIPKAQSEEGKVKSMVADASEPLEVHSSQSDDSLPKDSKLESSTNNAAVSVPLKAAKVDVTGPGLQMGAVTYGADGSDASRFGLGQELGSTFNYFDDDRSQSLNYPEQVALVMHLRDSESIPWDLQRQVVETVHAHDKNNDMQLSPQEYRSWLIHLLKTSNDSRPDLPGILPSIVDKICTNDDCSGS